MCQIRYQRPAGHKSKGYVRTQALECAVFYCSHCIVSGALLKRKEQQICVCEYSARPPVTQISTLKLSEVHPAEEKSIASSRQ